MNPLLRVLRLRPSLRLNFRDERAWLVGDGEAHVVAGRRQLAALAAVDGHRTVQEVLHRLGEELPPHEAFYALDQLEADGYLVEARPDFDASDADYWGAFGVAPGDVVTRLAAAPVAVVALGALDPQPVERALIEAGLHLAAGPRGEAKPHITVVLCHDVLDPGLEAINTAALTGGDRLLLARAGPRPWVGPLLRPGVGPCWRCLAQRVRANRPVETYAGAPLSRAGAGPATLVWEALIALTAARAVVLDEEESPVILEIRGLEWMRHPVDRLPQCPACGDPGLLARRARQPVLLGAHPCQWWRDGGFRSETPDTTLARLERLVDPVTGVLHSVGPLPGRHHPPRQVFAATRPCTPDRPWPVAEDFFQMSGGKGRGAAQARASAIGEALERYAASWQGDEPVVCARADELDAPAWAPPDLLHFSEAQFQRRHHVSPGDDPRHVTPEPFDAAARIDWSRAWSLRAAAPRYVPAACVWLRAPDPRFGRADSNGLSAGNCLEEAILQGFCELVERDAAAIWWYNELRRPAVDLEALSDAWIDEVVRGYAEAGWRVWALDLSADLGLPVVVAVARHREQGRVTLGFGCHPEGWMATQRALSELNQLFDPDRAVPAVWEPPAGGVHAWLEPDPNIAPRRFARPHECHVDLADEVRRCVDLAGHLGLDTLVLDLSRPDVPLHVVRVIVPGLRHIWPRFGPGRLYEVPVRLGWLASPRAEEDLNPTPLLL